MKKKMIPMILAAGALVLPVLITGCSLLGFTRDANLKSLRGHWVDVNGDTTLDFKGSRMTITYGSYKESYRVRVTNTSVQYIENVSNKYYDHSFGMISKIEIREEGRVLSAYEQVMDAEGHTYRFVREEDMEQETAVVDNSRDMPKTIESDEITKFSLSFSLKSTKYDVPEEEPWYSGQYTFELRQNEDGSYEMDFNAMGDSYVICQFTGTVPEDYAKGLAKLIQDQGIPANNGWSKTNNEHFHSWSLNVDYASGEKLRLSASGRPSLDVPFSIHAFLQYADQQAGYLKRFESETDETSETEPDSSAEDLAAFQGHWVDVNGETTLDFEGNKMTLTLFGRSVEEYTVRVVGDENWMEIENAEGNDTGFDLMSSLHVGPDGELIAYEQVLDADGHTFRFVREENLDRELAIEDLSEDLPKVIESDEIEHFSLSFSLDDTRFDVPEDSPWAVGSYTIELDRQADGGYELDFSAMGSSYVICQYRDTVSEEYARGLAALIQEQKIPEQNGSHLANSEDYDSWSLYAEYRSGEELQIIRRGRPALECPFSINAFLTYVNQEVKFSGEWAD